jgi:hypothetical protein
MIRVRYELKPTTAPAIIGIPENWIEHKRGQHSDWEPMAPFGDFSDWTYVFSRMLSRREAILKNREYLERGGEAEAAARIGMFIGEAGRELDLFIVIAVGTEL